MQMLQCLAWLGVAASITAAQKLRNEYPWYHTGAEIHSELQALANNCSGAQLELSTQTNTVNAQTQNWMRTFKTLSWAQLHGGEEIELDVIRISQGSSEGKKKAFFVFGEHARELISTESALQLLRTLCGRGDASSQDLVGHVLGSTSFVIVPNANPESRKRVEAGDYCKRTNENDVDLNRNWKEDAVDEEVSRDSETNPGGHGFSEPETLLIRDLLEAEKPDIFLSVHSGAYLLGTPFGYDKGSVASDQQMMLDVLEPISNTFCSGGCPYGNLADIIGYTSKGCDIDYVKNRLQTPYVFTWEIYADPGIRKFYIEEAQARAEKRDMNAQAKQFFSLNSLMFVQADQRILSRNLRGASKIMQPHSEDDPAACFGQFNPKTQAETKKVIENWTKAFLTLCDEVQSRSRTGLDEVPMQMPDQLPKAPESNTTVEAVQSRSTMNEMPIEITIPDRMPAAKEPSTRSSQLSVAPASSRKKSLSAGDPLRRWMAQSSNSTFE